MPWILLALVLALVVYELVALLNRRPGDTISEVVWTATTTHPILPFTLGLLMGHFFW